MENIKRDAFLFYRSYYDAIQKLPDADQLLAYKAIFDYALNGTEPTLTGVPSAVFMLVKPTLEKSRRKAENGRVGGKVKSKTEAKEKQTASKRETIKDKGQGIKDKGQGIKDIVSPVGEGEKRPLKIDYQGIIDMFNDICVSLSKVKELSDKRKKAIKAVRCLIEEHGGFKAFFEKVEASDFLCGRTDSQWSCGFDWIMKRSNAVKILEGNYDNKSGTKKSKNSEPDLYDVSRYENVEW